MSVAAAFSHPDGALPFCLLEFTPPAPYDYVDVPLSDVPVLFWTLEGLEFATSGTRGEASIDWTTSFGPIEVFPFSAPYDEDVTDGAYYHAGSPASAPVTKVCYVPPSEGVLISRTVNKAALDGFQSIEISILLGKTPFADSARVAYFFRFRSAFANDDEDAVIVANPAGAGGISGTPPSSGSVSLLGLPMDWVGGGYLGGSGIWSTETATLSVTSSAFTFP